MGHPREKLKKMTLNELKNMRFWPKDHQIRTIHSKAMLFLCYLKYFLATEYSFTEMKGLCSSLATVKDRIN